MYKLPDQKKMTAKTRLTRHPLHMYGIYRVIQKDGLNFVRLYFLNYTWYVNDLHNIWKRRSLIFKYHR
jgi:hypothetical protein